MNKSVHFFSVPPLHTCDLVIDRLKIAIFKGYAVYFFYFKGPTELDDYNYLVVFFHWICECLSTHETLILHSNRILFTTVAVALSQKRPPELISQIMAVYDRCLAHIFQATCLFWTIIFSLQLHKNNFASKCIKIVVQ